MRRLCATVLGCEAIVLALTIPVAIAVVKVDAAIAAIVGGGLAVACILAAGLLRFRWGYAVGSVLQVLVIATGFLVATMFFLGALFGALWVTAIWIGRKVESAEAR